MLLPTNIKIKILPILFIRRFASIKSFKPIVRQEKFILSCPIGTNDSYIIIISYNLEFVCFEINLIKNLPKVYTRTTLSNLLKHKFIK